MRTSIARLSSSLGLVLAFACGGGPAPGTATGVCVSGSCNPGLMCDGTLCVDEIGPATTGPGTTSGTTDVSTVTTVTSTTVTTTFTTTTTTTTTTDATTGPSLIPTCQTEADGCACDGDGGTIPDELATCSVGDFGRTATCCADAGWPQSGTLCDCRVHSCYLVGPDNNQCSCVRTLPDPSDPNLIEVMGCSDSLLASIGFTGTCCQDPEASTCICDNAVATCAANQIAVASCALEDVLCSNRDNVGQCK